MTFAFTDGFNAAQLAALDQMHAEFRMRIESCVFSVAAAKVLHERGEDGDCKRIVEVITVALAGTPPEELRGMLSLAVELIAGEMIEGMDDEEKDALTRGALQGLNEST